MKIRFALIATGLLLASCQEVEQPTTVLTQEQWKEVQQYILEEAPEPKYKVGANFEGKIEFIGFDVEEPIQSGKKTTFTWYWKALDDIENNWKVFVHFDSNVKPFRQNLDHVPVKGMFETGRWKKGQIVKDVQEVTIQRNFPAGKATPYIGFWRGDKRMKVENDVPKTDEDQPRVIGPTLMIGGGGSKTSKPAEPDEKTPPKYGLRQVKAEDTADLVIDGKLDEALWKRISPLKLSPFGAAEPQKAWVKAFVTDEHLVVGAHLEDQHIWGTLKNRDDETWKQEVLEMFLDPDGDGKDYLELQITPRGTIFDARFPVRLGTGEGTREEQIAAAKAWNLKGLKSAVHVEGTLNDESDQDEYWSVELQIPLKELPGLSETKPSTGDTWALNFYRFDRPQEGTTWAYAWSTEPRGDFHQVDKFGEARITSPVDLKRPVITPDMLREMRKNIDLKVPRDPRKANHKPIPNPNAKDPTKPASDSPAEKSGN